MSRRRNLQAAVEEPPTPDSLSSNQRLCVVGQGKGSNIFDVIDPNGHNFLVELPPKFRKNIWIRRGSYVIVTRTEELSGTKLEGTIDHVITSDQVKEWKRKGLWPAGFDNEPVPEPLRESRDELDLPEEASETEEPTQAE